MNLRVAVAVMLLGGATTASAETLNFGLRLGLTQGGYQNDSSFVVTELASGQDQQFVVASNDSWFYSFGLQTGASVAVSNFFADLSVEYLDVQIDGGDFDRSDLLLTAGYLIGDHWSAFAGYRRGTQGDGVFDDKTFSESGFFVGAGYAGFELGPFMMGTSLAYNFSKAEDFPFPGDEFDYGGVSLKLAVNPKAAPQHTIQLRYQRFTGDDSPRRELESDGIPVRVETVELTESYVQLSYAYAFYF
ncbi:hypothetical protein [Sinimarinibacterium thermocellulolyticum]|uniref:Outer membrane protein beta-barrel domain-containing protein n=1 Tax=Sinimarinibacterium thermocellulolyticum TaxID=3170016 RepID=A0ABV2A6F6_9GAMM